MIIYIIVHKFRAYAFHFLTILKTTLDIKVIMNIIKSQTLCKDNAINLPNDVKEALFIEIDYYEDDEYTITTLNIRESTYNFVHGFPGDNPAAVILDSNNERSLAYFGEARDLETMTNNPVEVKHMKKIYEWYMELTENMCNYEEFYDVVDK